MYPNQDQDQHQYPIDYLNQIAPPQQKKGPDKKLVVIFSVLGILVLLTVVGVIASSFSSGNTPAQQLAARLQTTDGIARKARPRLKSNQLRTLNSSLIIYLSNTNRDIKEPLAFAGINANRLDPETHAFERALADELTKKLEDARLNAVYDQTYAREMTFRLETIQLLMEQLQRQTNSQSMLEFLENALTNLEPIQTDFAEFTASNE